MPAQKVTAGLIGLGQIGQLLDEGKNPDTHCVTHAAALSSHSQVELLFGIDPSSENREKFSKRFKRPAFSSLSEMPNQKPDFWVIAGPTSLNFELFQKVIEQKPRLILIEKPLGENLEQAQKMVEMARAAQTSLAVNFMRRAEPGVRKMREILGSQSLGEIQKVIVTYSKGLSNNGSHFIDLMRFWFGDSSHHQIIGSVDQFFEKDIEPDFSIRFGKVSVFFLSLREKYFSARDIEIIGSKGAVHYLRGGQKILHHDVVSSSLYPGYRFLNLEGREIPSQLERVQYHVVDQIVRSMTEGKGILFDGTAGLQVMEDIERIKSLCRLQ